MIKRGLRSKLNKPKDIPSNELSREIVARVFKKRTGVEYQNWIQALAVEKDRMDSAIYHYKKGTQKK